MPPRFIALASAVVAALAVAAALIIALADHRSAPPAATAAKPAAFHPAATPQRVRARRARAAKALGPAGVVTTDRRTGGVRFAGRLDGFLTRRSGRDAAKVALGYGHRTRTRSCCCLELTEASTVPMELMVMRAEASDAPRRPRAVRRRVPRPPDRAEPSGA
jgi:hypothetical protein